MTYTQRSVDEIKAEMIKLFNLSDDTTLDYLTNNIPSDTVESKPIESSVDDIKQELVAVEEDNNGFPSRVSSVFLRNLTKSSVDVDYRRTALVDGTYNDQLIQLSGSERRYIGVSCNWSTYTNICTSYITTTITSATRV